MAKSAVVVIEQDLIKSRAWLSLNSAAKDVYLLFLAKRQMKRVRRKAGRDDEWAVTNNGEIVFTFAEAAKRYGIKKNRFSRALDRLHDHGFIGTARTGMGRYKMTTHYSLDDRWKKYGTAQFKPAHRPKAKHTNMGFRPGNALNPRQRKKKTSVKNEHGSMSKSEHGYLRAMFISEHGQIIETLSKWIGDKWLVKRVA